MSGYIFSFGGRKSGEGRALPASFCSTAMHNSPLFSPSHLCQRLLNEETLLFDKSRDNLSPLSLFSLGVNEPSDPDHNFSGRPLRLFAYPSKVLFPLPTPPSPPGLNRFFFLRRTALICPGFATNSLPYTLSSRCGLV